MAGRATKGPGSRLRPRNVVVAGRRTSVRLDRVLWEALQDAADRQGATVNGVLTEISRNRGGRGLTEAIRVYIVEFFWRGGRESALAGEARVGTARGDES